MDRSERLIRSGLTLASELGLETVLQRIVDEAVDLTDATYGALGVLGPDGRIAEFVTTGITPVQRAAIGDPPTGHGILGLLISDPRPVRIRNLADHEPRGLRGPAGRARVPGRQYYLGLGDRWNRTALVKRLPFLK
jgi:GAF domain-containing protein